MTAQSQNKARNVDETQQTLVQVVETRSGIVFGERDAPGLDAEKVAEGALRNLDCFRYSTRVTVLPE